VLEAIVQRVQRAARVAWLLDYDGTLVPFAPTPDLAVADQDLRALLAALGANPRFDVSVVSGRSRETLERWLGDLPISLYAEHGAWSRPAGKLEWTPLDGLACPWREAVLAVLEDFAARTPGAFVEEKHFGLAWHYRLADPEYGTSQANELRLHLTALLANDPVQVLSGDKVIEVRPHALHKGRVVEAARERAGEGALAVAVGDDTTDEDLFAALPADAVAVHVGLTATRAGTCVRDVATVRRFLRALLDRT
jgi:trehalose 6-phosphate synthase/phosphatase